MPKRISSILRSDERVLLWRKPVFESFILHLEHMWGFVLVGLFIFVGAMVSISIVHIPIPYGFLAIFALQIFFGLLMLFGPVARNAIAYNNTFYVITDRRILIQTGAIGIDTRIIDFDKMQEIYVTVDLVDRIFGTGSIKISTAAGWPEHAYMPTLVALRNPYQVHEVLQNAMEKTRH
ncbi:MAG: PH domain-containing protein [Candidatus Bathyarchaeia archaeon]|nr:PH domain-containing protein [Candidatus Bathyarchaeota archaeon]